MKVFVYEHVCGGGMVGEPIPDGLANQGMAMLAAAVEDFMATGARVVTMLDPRYADKMTCSDVRTVKSATSADEVFREMSTHTDCTLIIAPEYDGFLTRLTKQIEQLGVETHGCTSAAVALCSDKLALARHLANAGVNTPATAMYESGTRVDLPAIIKPRDGAGCEHIYVCRSVHDLSSLPLCPNCIAQPYLAGNAASVSLLIHGDVITPLAAGKQLIAEQTQLPAHLRYEGGQIPLDKHECERAIAMAMKAAKTITGLHGFVGIDVLLGDSLNDDAVIEINPRLTVSYVGLRHICESNLVAAMLDPHEPIRWSGRQVRFDAAGVIEVAGAPL